LPLHPGFYSRGRSKGIRGAKWSRNEAHETWKGSVIQIKGQEDTNGEGLEAKALTGSDDCFYLFNHQDRQLCKNQ